MKKILLASLAAASLIASEEVVMEGITVESTTLSDVSGEDIKSADTAEALAKQVPSITLVRRSGIANDIILRGQKRDNINVIVDGGKIYGACPNRMDPPTSHIITSNIDKITVIEGPYDVEHTGTLSGLVTVDTVKPEAGVHGNMNVGIGSFGYQKISGTITGGNDTVRALVGASGEWSNQYLDGDGNDFVGQIANYINNDPTKQGVQYQKQYQDMPAYAKKSLMAKLFIDLTDNQELRLSYIANRSQDVLYPNSSMDADYDNSDMYNAQYIAKDLGTWSKEFSALYYYSYVDHPMWTKWRNAALAMGTITNHLTSTIQGATLKNTTALDSTLDLTLGLDGSLRNWNGDYDKNGTYLGPSIDDANTYNAAVFAEMKKSYSNASVKLGMRYDNTRITSGNDLLPENHYEGLGANIFGDYQFSKTLGFFGGFGTATRVPDARELYFQSNSGMLIGTPDLDQTRNFEVDLGMKNTYDAFNLRTRLFYNKLNNYIYFDSSKTVNKFVNIDARIYGFEFSGSWYMTDTLDLDFGAAAQRGTKDRPLEGQTNTNLADIPPLKGNAALNWTYQGDSVATAEVIAANKWHNIDDQNGEQEIAAWAVLNLRVDHAFDKHFGMILGCDNVFDETYAVSNTYKDLTLLSVNPDGEVMLMNEPGRYFYANFTYNF